MTASKLMDAKAIMVELGVSRAIAYRIIGEAGVLRIGRKRYAKRVHVERVLAAAPSGSRVPSRERAARADTRAATFRQPAAGARRCGAISPSANITTRTTKSGRRYVVRFRLGSALIAVVLRFTVFG